MRHVATDQGEIEEGSEGVLLAAAGRLAGAFSVGEAREAPKVEAVLRAIGQALRARAAAVFQYVSAENTGAAEGVENGTASWRRHRAWVQSGKVLEVGAWQAAWTLQLQQGAVVHEAGRLLIPIRNEDGRLRGCLVLEAPAWKAQAITRLTMLTDQIEHAFPREDEAERPLRQASSAPETQSALRQQDVAERPGVPEPGVPEQSTQVGALLQLGEPLLVVDREARLRALNDEAETLLSLPAPDGLGRLMREVGRSWDGDDVDALLSAAWDRGEGGATVRLPGGPHLEVRARRMCIIGAEPFVAVVLRDVTRARRHEAHLRHRARMEHVLAEVTQLFVSPGSIDPEELLRALGRATEAHRVYLITTPPDRPEEGRGGAVLLGRTNGTCPQAASTQAASTQAQHRTGWPVGLDDYTYQEWCVSEGYASNSFGDGAYEHDEQWATFAVPVLSPQGKLYGYLGIEYDGAAPAWLVEEKRMLDVMGDVLSAYLERQMAETALKASEERYRSFVTTISEGIWCVEPAQALPVAGEAAGQVKALREQAVVTECNDSMAHVLAAASAEQAVGRRAGALLPDDLAARFFADFVAQDYQLQNEQYTVEAEGQEPRHFIANAVGVVEQGRLVRLWGSWTDVTARVDLERRMVSALEQQQQRIGHELHDGVGQLITSVSMLSENLAQRYFGEGEQGYDQAQRIVRFTRQASQLLRELQRGLAPVQVQGRGLADALEQLARSTDELPGASCQYDHDGATDVTENEAKLQLYRIAQEATNNALKHAEPSQIQISLRRQEDGGVLQVRDNGKGFAVEEHRTTSLGLHSMAYRARSIGADLNIRSAPEQGTTVQCVFPTQQDAEVDSGTDVGYLTRSSS